MKSRSITFVIFGILFLGLVGFSQSASAAVYDGTKAGIMLTFEHTSTSQLDAFDENNLRNDMVGTLGPLSARVGNSGLMTQQEMLDLQSIGWEIASHSATHDQIDDSTPESVLIADIVQSKTDLENMGFQVKGYIPPFNTITLASFELMKNNYEWTSFWGPIQPDPREMTLQTLEDSFDTHGMYHLYAWGVGNVYSMNTADAVKTKIDEAIANNYLIGFKFHKIEDGDFPTSTSPAMFTEIIDYLREQRDLGNLDIMTRSQGYGSFGPDTTAPITTANPPGGSYFSAQQITLTADEPATIYYTTDGSTPTTSSSVYSTKIPLSTNTTLKFFAKDNFGNEESVKTEEYAITIDPTAPITTANPSGGSYFFDQLVALTADEPATIYYATDGFPPNTCCDEYSTKIPISTGTTFLKFFAIDTAGNPELVNTELYIITPDIEKPVITPLGPSKSIAFGSTYMEFGAFVDDNDTAYSGTVTVAGDTVDTFTPGSYIITYNAPSDASGNIPDEKTITIIVDTEPDIEKPVITPTGTSRSIAYGSTYTELGGTVNDNDPDYAEMVTVGGDFVNPFIPGDYMKTYNAPADASGNTPDEKTITITVEVFAYPICEDLPSNGTWMISASCTLENSFFAPGNVKVQSNSVLVIQDGDVLHILPGFNITIVSGSGVQIEVGGGLEVQRLT